jgi:pimeloyl-ACP methyl ester carboxylesterase
LTSLTFERYQQQANFIKLLGHDIAFWRSSDFGQDSNKATILFIHGFPSAAWDWHYQWQHLAKDYQLISLDLLGYGLSDKPVKHQYSLLEQANIIEALLAAQGVSRCHILAHDYGDSVAQELLSRQPSKSLSILSLCLLNGGLFASHHRPLFAQKLLKSPLGGLAARFMSKKSLSKSFSEIFGKDTPPEPQDIDILWKLLEHNKGMRVIPKLLTYIDERSVHGERWKKAMIETSIPLYFINGVQDPISGQHMLDYYREVIPNPQTAALNVGHYPQIEAPQQVLTLYNEFLMTVENVQNG